MPDLRRLLEEDERRPAAAPAPAPVETPPTQVTQLMGLQRSAGNAAVARLLADQLEHAGAALARAPTDAPAAGAAPAVDDALVALWESSVVTPAGAAADALEELTEPSLPGADQVDAKQEDPPQRETFFREWDRASKSIDVVSGQLGDADRILRLRLEVLAAAMHRIDTDVRLILGARPSFKWAADACASGHAAMARLGRKLRPASGGDRGAPSARTTAALVKALYKANVSDPMRPLGRELAKGGPKAGDDALRVVDQVVEHLAGLHVAYADDPATRDLQLEIELLLTQTAHLRDGLEVLRGGDPPTLEDVQADARHTADHDTAAIFGAAAGPPPRVPAAR